MGEVRKLTSRRTPSRVQCRPVGLTRGGEVKAVVRLRERYPTLHPIEQRALVGGPGLPLRVEDGAPKAGAFGAGGRNEEGLAFGRADAPSARLLSHPFGCAQDRLWSRVLKGSAVAQRRVGVLRRRAVVRLRERYSTLHPIEQRSLVGGPGLPLRVEDGAPKAGGLGLAVPSTG